MKPIKNTLRLLGRIYMIVGAPFIAASVVFIILRLVLTFESPSDAPLAFVILAGIFGLTGAVFFILGLCFYMYVRNKYIKNQQLKREGIRYDAEIVRTVPKPYMYMRFGSYVNMAVHAECSYINNENKLCLVKSESFMQYNPNEKLKASVYVSRGDPKDYFVDIQLETEANIQFDYDYR